MPEPEPADVALLEALAVHPAHGAVVAHAVHDADGTVRDFVIERATEAAARLLGPGLDPGVAIGRLAGGRGSEGLPELIRLGTEGGWARLRRGAGRDRGTRVAGGMIGAGGRG